MIGPVRVTSAPAMAASEDCASTSVEGEVIDSAVGVATRTAPADTTSAVLCGCVCGAVMFRVDDLNDPRSRTPTASWITARYTCVGDDDATAHVTTVPASVDVAPTVPAAFLTKILPAMPAPSWLSNRSHPAGLVGVAPDITNRTRMSPPSVLAGIVMGCDRAVPAADAYARREGAIGYEASAVALSSSVSDATGSVPGPA